MFFLFSVGLLLLLMKNYANTIKTTTKSHILDRNAFIINKILWKESWYKLYILCPPWRETHKSPSQSISTVFRQRQFIFHSSISTSHFFSSIFYRLFRGFWIQIIFYLFYHYSIISFFSFTYDKLISLLVSHFIIPQNLL